MNRYLLAVSASMLLILGACSKSDNSPSPQEDLRSGTWYRPVVDSQYVPGKVTYKDPVTNGDSTRPYTPHNLFCHLDNSIQFKTNNAGTLNYGFGKCSGSEAENKTFTWQMSDDGSRLSMYGVGDFFGTDNVEATVLTRSMGMMTIRYRQVTIDPRFQTSDTLIFTDVLRRF